MKKRYLNIRGENLLKQENCLHELNDNDNNKINKFTYLHDEVPNNFKTLDDIYLKQTSPPQ